MRLIALFLLFGLMFPAVLCAELGLPQKPVVADISDYEIRIDSNFTGTRLILFGTRSNSGDVVVVLRGPQKNYIVRKKKRVGGLWVNTEQAHFSALPEFYTISTSRPMADLPYSRFFTPLGIGNEAVMAQATKTREQNFAQAFLNAQAKKHLYATDAGTVQIVEDTLFKSYIPIPDNVPRGKYTAEIYLFNDGELLGSQVLPVIVSKSGMDAFVYDLAHHYPAIYGLFAVGMALIGGWIASSLFEKFYV